ncbi:MAG: DinB family protein [Flavobacteriales bacterium]|nr:DinB family protein [Flavobacteriales bacterium]
MALAPQLAHRFREVILDGTWIANTNFKHQISELSVVQATTKIGNFNTIALLTFHVNYYTSGLVQVFKGGTLDIRDKFSFDAPELKSENDWIELKETLFKNAERFAEFVEQMTDNELNADFIDPKYGSYYRNIEALIEHAYYHLGQVSLLKKMIVNS